MKTTETGAETVTLEIINQMPESELQPKLAACCGAERWQSQMISRRPFTDLSDLWTAADEAADVLEREDCLQAFAHHPRIGDIQSLRERFGTRSGSWSEGEQAGMSGAEEAVLERLAEGNRLYEQRFGFLFIICASGKTAKEMLTALQSRLENEPVRELRIAAAEQHKITRLRLEKWLNPTE